MSGSGIFGVLADRMADRLQGHMAAVVITGIKKVGEFQQHMLIPDYGGRASGWGLDYWSPVFASFVVDSGVKYAVNAVLIGAGDEVCAKEYSAHVATLAGQLTVGQLSELEEACSGSGLHAVFVRMKGTNLPENFPVIAYDQLVLRKN
ncbi:hypothetical protein HYU15_01885 [Candidatus Woesearchaeota archaeon]|nr:hypothetical protein [Candidatus Woesearchaeota archaeon]